MANNAVILSARLPRGPAYHPEVIAPQTPRITIARGELLDFPANFIVMSTERTMELDLQISTGGRRRMGERLEWREKGRLNAPAGAPPLIDTWIGSSRTPRSGLNAIQNSPADGGGYGLAPQRANVTPPGMNNRHNAVIVVNVPKPTIIKPPPFNSDEYQNYPADRYNPQSNQCLRQVIFRALDACRPLENGNLPGWLHQGTPDWFPDFAHQNGKRSIAFNLIGSNKDIGYGLNNAAEQVLGSIVAYFNHGLRDERRDRRNVFNHVYLLVSGRRHEQPRKIEQAWTTAWNRYISPPPGAPPPGTFDHASARLPDNPAMQAYVESISGTRTLRSGVRGRR